MHSHVVYGRADYRKLVDNIGFLSRDNLELSHAMDSLNLLSGI